jgi:hypothetical protein
MMNKKLIISYGHATHQGLKRADNQDAFGKFPPDSLALSLPKGQLFIVADGMGGHANGKEASAMAVQIVQQVYFADPNENIPDSLRAAVEAANEKIHQRATSKLEFRGMGTTCTALVLKDDRAYIAHVGDSRAYRISKSKIEQLTQDHSKVAEMQRLGILTESLSRPGHRANRESRPEGRSLPAARRAFFIVHRRPGENRWARDQADRFNPFAGGGLRQADSIGQCTRRQRQFDGAGDLGAECGCNREPRAVRCSPVFREVNMTLGYQQNHEDFLSKPRMHANFYSR